MSIEGRGSSRVLVISAAAVGVLLAVGFLTYFGPQQETRTRTQELQKPAKMKPLKEMPPEVIEQVRQRIAGGEMRRVGTVKELQAERAQAIDRVWDAEPFSLSPESIQRMLAGAGPGMKDCYRSAITFEPGLEPSMMVNFDLQPAGGGIGRIAGIDTVSEADTTTLDACIVKALGGVRFEGLEEATNLEILVEFASE